MGEVYPFRQNKDEKTQSYRARFKDDPVIRAMMQTKLKKKVSHKRAKADEVLWYIDGEGHDRYQMMNLLVHLVSEGYSLAEICEDNDFPTLKEVREWCPNHPGFERDLIEAEKVRGEILGEMALQVAMGASNQTVAADKLRYEALSKSAARLNQKYQDKQVVQTEDKTDRMTEEQIRERLVAMVEAHPELAAIITPSLGLKEREGTEVPPDSDAPSDATSSSHREGE